MNVALSTYATASSSTVTAASAQATMVKDGMYRIASSTNCWIKFGANPTAVAQAADNHYLPANQPVFVLCQGLNVKVAFIRDTADGFASVSLMSI